MTKRTYSHRRNPVHRAILCGLFRTNRRQYRHRRGILGPFLQWLFGIQPRRSNYANNQYYATNRNRGAGTSTRYSGSSGSGGRAPTIAEQHAARYRTAQPGGRSAPVNPTTGLPSQPHRARSFHQARPSGRGVEVSVTHQPAGNQIFQPLPRPAGHPPYHLPLSNVLPPVLVNAIERSGRLMLLIVGDTGGVKSPEPQQIVAMAMEAHFNFPDATLRPSFFYHLGDVVYYYGEGKEYFPQFYDAYVHYPAPIFAIPGNHDGDRTDGSAPSLTSFANNFCAPTPHLTAEAGETQRDAMTQPHVYWTLEAPFATIVGMYSNVPEGGQIDNDQFAWYVNELRTAPTDKALIVAVHHPPVSGDSNHSGSTYMAHTLDRASQQAGRFPDIVFSGHVHNYQRFTREVSGGHIPYIVAGAGGYWHLHYIAKQADGSKTPVPFKIQGSDLTLENYCDDRHGFMRVMVTPQYISGEYFAVPRPHESWRGQAERIDGFVLDWRAHRLTKGTDLR